MRLRSNEVESRRYEKDPPLTCKAPGEAIRYLRETKGQAAPPTLQCAYRDRRNAAELITSGVFVAMEVTT